MFILIIFINRIIDNMNARMNFIYLFMINKNSLY